jgi:hypothetical protein
MDMIRHGETRDPMQECKLVKPVGGDPMIVIKVEHVGEEVMLHSQVVIIHVVRPGTLLTVSTYPAEEHAHKERQCGRGI